MALTDTDRTRGWLRLARCPGISPRDAHRLVARVGTLRPFVAPDRAELRRRGVTEKCVRQLASARLNRHIDKEVERSSRAGVTLLACDDPRYPPFVRALADPPPVLSVLGDPRWLGSLSVAFVGSRAATGYGLAMASRFAAPLAACGVVVASGLARGIDAAAHRAALDVGGATVAVLGTGIDRIYPKEHRSLAQRIESDGALVSEFPPGTPPRRENFPRRNRVIAGLSLAIVVVEAALRSGSLVTARWALEEGREVLAVPGRIGESAAEGTIALLREGAAPAIEVEDILAALPSAMRSAFLGESEVDLAHAARLAADLALCDDAAPGSREVFRVLPPHDELHVDELCDRVEIPAAKVLEALFALEIRGVVEPLPGGLFRRHPARRGALPAPDSDGGGAGR